MSGTRSIVNGRQRTRYRYTATFALGLLAMACAAGCGDIFAGAADDKDQPGNNGPDAPRPGANRPPTAIFGDDRSVLSGDPVFFDASASADTDGSISEYRWDFGDGGFSEGETAEHVFAEAGVYTVTLTVVDDQGATAEAEILVTVREAPPVRFELAVDVDPPGAGQVVIDPPGDLHEAGTMITLTAVPSEGFRFLGFAQDVTGEAATADLFMDSDKAVTALFAVIEVEVEVAVEPPDAGRVLLDPPGGRYASGTRVTLIAEPNLGFAFDSFADATGGVVSSDARVSLEVEEDAEFVAQFRRVAAPPPTTFTLSVSAEPAGGGTVALNPPGGVYEAGTMVTVTAAPAEGYAFLGFSGAVVTTESTDTVTMDADKAVAAEFEWVPAIGNPGNLLVTGLQGGNVLEFDRFDGGLLGEFVAAGTAGLAFAWGIDIGPDGDVFVVNVPVVADASVVRFNGQTGIPEAAPFIAGDDALGFFTLRFGPNGNLFVPDSGNDSIGRYDSATGDFVSTFVSAGAGELADPLGLVFGPGGNLFVASKGNDRIIEYDGGTGDAVGTVVDLAAAGFSVPFDLTFGPDGALYVSLSGNDSVARVDLDSGSAEPFVVSQSGGLRRPAGVVFHPGTGNLLVVSSDTNSVLEYDGDTGAYLGVFAVGDDDGSLFLCVFRAG